MNYSRTSTLETCRRDAENLGGGRWIRTTEGVSQQIYSLPPLAAWVSLHREPVIFAAAAVCQRPDQSTGFRPTGSDVEAEVQHVAFLDHVFLALQAQAAGIAGAGLAACTG